jgi:DTW domain-containing protein YfiP
MSNHEGEFPSARATCYACRKPKMTCYCADLKPVASRPRIVILMHPLEARHPVGTGRMAHRSLSNSHLWVGKEFGEGSELIQLLRDPVVQPLLLFPGPKSLDLSKLSSEQKDALLNSKREPVIIVLDATWSLAKKMLRLSPELQRIQRVSFAADSRSRFLVRKQPQPECLSSLEAIHRVLTIVDETNSRSYDGMLEAFEKMVAKQIAYGKATALQVPVSEASLA